MAETRKITKDNYLFREGDTPDAMYIVRTGSFAITKSKGISEIVLAEIKVGSMVGEMALFDRKPRSANVKALADSEVIALPYDSLEKQLDVLPLWLKAILKTLNENLREANKKIKILENPIQKDDDRFPPQTITKLLSIINLVGFKYGKQTEEGLSISSYTLRNYTIQVFGEATNKMQSMLTALKTMGYFLVEDIGEGRQKLINLKPDHLFQFVDWYNEWLFKPDKDKLEPMRDDEVKVLQGIMYFANKVQPNAKGFRKINLNQVQNESMKEIGSLLKTDDVNSLIEKKYIPEKMMEEAGVSITIHFEELQPLAQNWSIISGLRKNLK